MSRHVDLGVMGAADKILDVAQKENADIVGLSGLITPSLDEMVYVASEMQRRGMKQPLLIGGATTSRAHTSVKIDKAYDEPVVWVKDASRAVGVASKLLSEQKADFAADQYGPAFTIETGMQASFAHRVNTAVLAAQTAVDVFASRYS